MDVISGFRKIFFPQSYILGAENDYNLEPKAGGPILSSAPARIEQVFAKQALPGGDWTLYKSVQKPMRPMGYVENQILWGTRRICLNPEARSPHISIIEGGLSAQAAFDRVRHADLTPPKYALVKDSNLPACSLRLRQNAPDSPRYWRRIAPSA